MYKVSDELYRSGQPSTRGMRNLKKLGIKTVLNLRSFHSDREKVSSTGLECEQIHEKAWDPEVEQAVFFLRIVTDPERTPVLVHCWQGADRTGAMIAIYRMAVQGWSKEEAIREMTEGGFGFHRAWDNLCRWLGQLDLDRIKRGAGVRQK